MEKMEQASKKKDAQCDMLTSKQASLEQTLNISKNEIERLREEVKASSEAKVSRARRATHTHTHTRARVAWQHWVHVAPVCCWNDCHPPSRPDTGALRPVPQAEFADTQLGDMAQKLDEARILLANQKQAFDKRLEADNTAYNEQTDGLKASLKDIENTCVAGCARASPSLRRGSCAPW